MKTRKRSNQHNQKGVALVIALVVLFLLTALAAALIFATQSEMWATNNYQQLTQSRYAAETGAQMAKNWFENPSNYVTPTSLTNFNTTGTYVKCASGATACTSNSPIILGGSTHNFPTASVETSFYNALTSQSVPGVPNATYSVTAELLQMPSLTGTQVWQVTSTGTVAGVKTATTQVTENINYVPGNGNPTFQYAVQATGDACATQGNPPTGITFSSSGFTDSYNSSSGAYGGTNVVASGGNVYTPGNVNLSGSAEIKGNLVSPNTAQTPAGCSGTPNLLSSSSSSGTHGIGGSIQTMTAPAPAVPSLPSTGSASDVNISSSSCPAGLTCPATPACSGGANLPPGTYRNLDVKSPVCLVAGIYNFNSIAASGGNNITVGSGPITINLGATSTSTLSGDSSGNVINMSGGSSFANPGDNSTNLRINYGGSLPINLSGGSTAAAAVDAPNSPVTLSSGHGDWYGAIICNALNDSGGASIHFDSALLSAFSTGPTTPAVSVAGFTWNKN